MTIFPSNENFLLAAILPPVLLFFEGKREQSMQLLSGWIILIFIGQHCTVYTVHLKVRGRKRKACLRHNSFTVNLFSTMMIIDHVHLLQKVLLFYGAFRRDMSIYIRKVQLYVSSGGLFWTSNLGINATLQEKRKTFLGQRKRVNEFFYLKLLSSI